MHSLLLLFTTPAVFGQDEDNLLRVNITCSEAHKLKIIDEEEFMDEIFSDIPYKHLDLVVEDRFPLTAPENIWTILEEIDEEREVVNHRWFLFYHTKGTYYGGVELHGSVKALIGEDQLIISPNTSYRVSIVEGENTDYFGLPDWPAIGDVLEAAEVTSPNCFGGP